MKGKVYKIVHNKSNICYVGSTFNSLAQRWQHHKADYAKWLNGKKDNIAIYAYFKKHGIENFRIMLIQEYEVLDRRHLETKEQLWISKLKACNTNNPIELPLKKHYMQLYVNQNKDHLREVGKLYRAKHKIEIGVKQIKQYECSCGTLVRVYGKARHEKSKKHQTWMQDGISIQKSRKREKY